MAPIQLLSRHDGTLVGKTGGSVARRTVTRIAASSGDLLVSRKSMMPSHRASPSSHAAAVERRGPGSRREGRTSVTSAAASADGDNAGPSSSSSTATATPSPPASSTRQGPTGLNVNGARPTSPKGWNAMIAQLKAANVRRIRPLIAKLSCHNNIKKSMHGMVRQ